MSRHSQLIRYFPLGCYCLLGFFFLACTSSPTPKQPSADHVSGDVPIEAESTPASNAPLIMFMGNSLTAGFGVEISEAFPSRIQQFIDSLGLAYEVRNSGISGETSAGGKDRITFLLETLDKPIEAFVLELGANDALRGLPVTEVRSNLQYIIDRVRSKFPEAKIVLCGMLAPPNMGPEYTEAFQKIYPELALLNQSTLVPFLLEGVAGIPSLNLADGIHPTPEGHKLLANTVWEHLGPLLQ